MSSSVAIGLSAQAWPDKRLRLVAEPLRNTLESSFELMHVHDALAAF